MHKIYIALLFKVPLYKHCAVLYSVVLILNLNAVYYHSHMRAVELELGLHLFSFHPQ